MNSNKLQIQRLALGTVQFGLKYGVANLGGKISLDSARHILRNAREVGISTIDTAIAYGDSEQRLGEIGLGDLRVITKLPGIPNDCSNIPNWIYKSVHESLSRLKVGRLAGLLLHKPLEILSPFGDQLYASLQQLKQDGIVEQIGISIYEPSELDAVCNRYRFDVVQAPFNILDRRLIESDWMYRLHGEGIELHARSVFLQGLLLMRSVDRPMYFSQWQSLWEKWDRWFEINDTDPLAACLGYVLSFPQIKKIIVGVDHLEHFTSILTSINREKVDWPTDIFCEDAKLLNPSQWTNLK